MTWRFFRALEVVRFVSFNRLGRACMTGPERTPPLGKIPPSGLRRAHSRSEIQGARRRVVRSSVEETLTTLLDA